MHSRRRARLVSALAALAVLLMPARARAETTGTCEVTFNGVEVGRIDSLASPLELRHDAVLTFEGTSETGTTRAAVQLRLIGFTLDEGSSGYAEPQTSFSAELPLDDVSPYGVGLYRIRGIVDGCTSEAWMRITGRFPLATLTGLTAAGLTLGGLFGQLTGLLARRRSSPFLAAIGGVATGLGGALLGQQFGRLELSYLSLSVAIAGAAGLGLTLGLLMLRSSEEPKPDKGAEERRRKAVEDRPVHPTPPEAEPDREAAAGTTGEPVSLRLERLVDDPALRPVAPATATEAPFDPFEKPAEAADVLPETAEAAAEQPVGAERPAEEPAVTPVGAEPAEPVATTAEAAALQPYWSYVMAAVEVFDLIDHTTVVATLSPGSWYLARREAGGWAHVVVGEGVEGWVPRTSLHRQG
jgi:hypothetical protein